MTAFKFVRSGSVDLCTQAFGDAGDPPILLIMGATASMMWWPESLCRGLANAGRVVIRFDHRDTGESTTGTPGETDYTIDDIADDVLAILDAYGLADAHLVGMSLGGFAAQLVALRNPDRVSSLTLIGSEPLGGATVETGGIDQGFLDHFATMGELDWSDRAAVRAFLARIAELSAPGPRGWDRPASLARIDAEMARTPNMLAAFNHSAIGGDFDRWDASEIRKPTQVIHGAYDPILPLANGEALAERIEGARLQILPEAGHELHGQDLGTIQNLILRLTNVSK